MKWMIASDIHGSAYYCRKMLEAYKEEKDAVAKILKENMEHAADLLVPLDVEVHEGASWFEAK